MLNQFWFTMVYCSKCGTKSLNENKFCSNCGNRLITNIENLSKPQKIRDLRGDINQSAKYNEQSTLQKLGVTPTDSVPSSYSLPPDSAPNSETPWLIIGIVGFLVFGLLLVIIFSGGSYDTASVTYSGCWSGAFSDGDFNIISIDGCGNESFACDSSGYCGINAQKQDDSSGRLCVSIGSNEACTTAAYGIASV